MAKITLKDLAQRANVSWKTVSRVVNNKPGGVSPDKRAEIEALIAETGFRPNRAARSLSASRSYVVAVVIQSPGRHYYISEIQIGAMQACTAEGYHLVLEAIGDRLSSGPEAVKKWLSELRPDGLLLLPPLSHNQALLDILEAAQINFVRVSPLLESHHSPAIGMDDERAVFDITKKLLDLGHQSFGYVGLGGQPAINAVRQSGFEAALASAGIAVNPAFMPSPPDGHYPGSEQAEAILRQAAHPTAIVCASDTLALGVMAAAAKLKISIPEDLSVVGFDNAPGTESTWPPLTTIEQPIRRIGYDGVRMLVQQRSSTDVTSLGEHVVLDYRLIDRQTTAPPTIPAQPLAN